MRLFEQYEKETGYSSSEDISIEENDVGTTIEYHSFGYINWLERKVKEIEKLKICGNCKYFDIYNTPDAEPYFYCFVFLEETERNDKCDKWELME